MAKSKKLPNVIPSSGGLIKCPRTHHIERDPRLLDYVVSPDLYVRNGFKAVVCTGEAHSNAHIDHCSLCAPAWGVRAVAVDLTADGECTTCGAMHTGGVCP